MTRWNRVIAAVIVGVPAVAIAWWLGSPLFIDAEVSEAFPMSARAEVPDDMTREQVEKVMTDAAAEPSTSASDDLPSEGGPEPVSSGEFADFDSFHRGSGTATVYRLGDGSQILRLEGLDVTNGPDLHVLLVPHPNPASREDITGYRDLGALKGNIGDQNYPIPSDVDAASFGSVVIYCVPFHVIFTVASLG